MNPELKSVTEERNEIKMLERGKERTYEKSEILTCENHLKKHTSASIIVHSIFVKM